MAVASSRWEMVSIDWRQRMRAWEIRPLGIGEPLTPLLRP